MTAETGNAGKENEVAGYRLVTHVTSGEKYVACVGDVMDTDGEYQITAMSDALYYTLASLIEAGRIDPADIATERLDEPIMTAEYRFVEPDAHAADDLTPEQIANALSM